MPAGFFLFGPFVIARSDCFASLAMTKGRKQATGLPETHRMIKEAKYLRKQADKAQRLSAVASDPDISRNLMNLASGYRAQAKILKKKKPKKKD
jgi:hypothetical protein